MNGEILKPYTILVVDDDSDLRDVVITFARLEGWSIEVADGGLSGIEKLKSHSFDLVLSDIRMPAGSGVDLIVAARKICPSTPVILMSGFSDLSATEIQDLGAKALVRKPFDWDSLCKLLVTTIEQARADAKKGS